MLVAVKSLDDMKLIGESMDLFYDGEIDPHMESLQALPFEDDMEVSGFDFINWDDKVTESLVVKQALMDTYNTIIIMGRPISFIGFDYGEQPVLIDTKYRYASFVHSQIAQDIIDSVAEYCNIRTLYLKDAVLHALKWCTDMTIEEIFKVIREYLTMFDDIKPLAILACSGFYGALLRIMGLLERVARYYLPPWWYSLLTMSSRRVYDLVKCEDLYPRGVIETLRRAWAIPGAYEELQFRDWGTLLKGTVRPPEYRMHVLNYAGGNMNVLITSEGYFFIPAHLFKVSQAYEVKCTCGKSEVLFNTLTTSCCNVDAYTIHDSRPHMISLGRRMDIKLGNTLLEVLIIASAGDMLLCYAPANGAIEMELRSSISINQFKTIDPTNLDSIITLHSVFCDVDLPAWHYDGKALIRSSFGVPGICGSVLTLISVPDHIVGINVSMHHLLARLNHALIPAVLLELVYNGICESGKTMDLVDWCAGKMVKIRKQVKFVA